MSCDNSTILSEERRPRVWGSKLAWSVGIVAVFAMAPIAEAQASFQGLGHLWNGVPHSRAYAVSDDGSVVVGFSYSELSYPQWEAFRWTADSGMEALGDLPGGAYLSLARGVSADGSVIVGHTEVASGGTAFRWTEGGGMEGLGFLPGSAWGGEAWAASADGSIIVGEAINDEGHLEAFRWTRETGMVGLGHLAPMGQESTAWSVSAHGSIVVGRGFSYSGYEAFMWTANDGMIGLGDFDGGDFASWAWDITPDGAVIVGGATDHNGTQAFRWTEASGMLSLGEFATGEFPSAARSVSNDGSLVIGDFLPGSGTSEPFLWDASNGMRRLHDVLVDDYGLAPQLAGWTLKDAYDISGDGTTIVGWGVNPDGRSEAWIARLAPLNEPPVANAGPDQSIHASDLVCLDGSGSFDDNTPSDELEYSWTLTVSPEGSGATLTGADTSTPCFTADLPGTYMAHLVVTDAEGLTSDPNTEKSTVTISSGNLAPTADAGPDAGAIVGDEVELDGTGSSDPDGDALTYAWAITGAPEGSTATLAGETTSAPTFTPDLPGQYTVQLVVNDSFVDSDYPDEVVISAIMPGDYAQGKILEALEVINGLCSPQDEHQGQCSPAKVTTKGNQTALGNFLTQAIAALQEEPADIDQAISKLDQAIARIDGCVLRGKPDGAGAGRDWITDCDAQVLVYDLLIDALTAITP